MKVEGYKDVQYTNDQRAVDGEVTSRVGKGDKYATSYTKQPRTGMVTDADIYAFVKKHTHWWDRFDLHFVSDCVLAAQDILWGYVVCPVGKWYFGKYGKGFEGKWIDKELAQQIDWEEYKKRF